MLKWLKLLRFPNVFTALADILLGWFVTHIAWTIQSPAPQQIAQLVLLLFSSASLYLAGMVLNDVFDVAEDTRDRPARPLPSKSISLSLAKRTGWALLIVGVLFGWGATLIAGQIWCGITATALAVAVVVYDGGMKRTVIGPAVMGSCRWLNVLLGMSAGTDPLPAWQLILAAGIGVYIMGVTIFAKGEAGFSSRPRLMIGLIVMYAGLALLWWGPLHMAEYPVIFKIVSDPQRWNLTWLALGAIIGIRCIAAINDPQPALVQSAIVLSLRSLIMLDAVACYSVCDVTNAVVILILIVPMLLLGRIIYST